MDDSTSIIDDSISPPIKVATCVPRQCFSREAKLEWLENAVMDTDCDLFLTPQEFFGGHYIMKDDLHMEREWMVDKIGTIAGSQRKCIGVGACVKDKGQGATEDYMYFDSGGALLGWHSKFALPAYDDQRAGGHGQLWPETNYLKRIMPIEIPELRLKVGTMFCWEIFAQALWGLYSFAGVNLIAHPIKFAPRGWLNNKKQDDGFLHIVGFGNAPNSEIWVERLLAASKHQVMCPIAVSCNSWCLGEKFMALTGHVDEFKTSRHTGPSTELHNIPATAQAEKIHVFEMVPEFYEGIDHHHSGGAFKAHVGSIDGFSEMGEWTMHGKIRRLEAQLIGGSTAMDCALKVATRARQKKSVPARAFGKTQPIRLPKRRE